MENTVNLSPLTEQVQRWWDSRHQTCDNKTELDLLEPYSGSLSTIFRNEDLIGLSVICPSTCGWRGTDTRDELVSELQREVRASAVRAARLLDQPAEEAAEKVAAALLPTPYGDELTLITDLIIAAGAQSAFQQKQALKGAGWAAAMIVGFLVIGLGNRQAA